jgi:peroxiredoxin
MCDADEGRTLIMAVVGFNRIVINISALMLMALLLVCPNRSFAYDAEVGNRAADFTGFDIVNRESIQLEDFLGQWVFMEFWATWCGPCMRELPNMLEQTRPFVDSDQLKVITINGDPPELRQDLWQDIRKYNITYPVIHDGGIYDPMDWNRPIVAVEWGVHVWPSSFLNNPQGVIVANNLRGDKLGAALGFFLSSQPPILGLRGNAELNDDGSVSVYAYVMNASRQDVKLRMRAFIEKLLWD